MWKMFDDMIECDECGGPLGPPPKFMIPPPPRPPSMAEFTLSNCNEEEMALKAKQAWDNDMCEAMPILDASLYSSQSLQTSAMIAVFSLLLVLVVLISSLFVWKNKRKVQNFLPCKTPTRGPHINGGLPLGGGHSVTYEDPDAHLGHHRPLVMRHHHNVEIVHGKSIHYPSGYPMTRSPPFLVSSSPGPDPYRSHDNVYEELGPGHDSDGESEPPLHSDDDFAEDELSLPGERSFNKSNVSDATSTHPGVSTIYHERNGPANSSGNLPERTSVLSSSSSNQDASTATVASSSSSHNNNNSNGNGNGAAAGGTTPSTRSGPGGLLSGMLRHTTGRSKFHTTNGARAKGDRKNNSTDDANADGGDLRPMQQMYDNRSNLMSLAYLPHQQQMQHPHQQPVHGYHHHSLHHINNNNNNNNNGRSTAPQFYNTMESEVERRNRINAQLSHAPAVSTIFRERINYPGSGRYPQPYYTSNGSNGLMANSMRTRTNPRSMDRRHRIAVPLEPIEPAYGYAEPLYHENYHYDTCGTPTLQQRLTQPLVYPSYITPDGSGGSATASYRGTPHHHHHHHQQQQPQHQPQHHHQPTSSTYQNSNNLYSRGDSSFGSDSGYSHHTPASSIGRHDYDVALPMPVVSATSTTPKATGKLSAALSFGWNRRKSSAATNVPTSLHVQHHAAGVVNNTNVNGVGSDEATLNSPNNNSISPTTVTSTLENSSSASSGVTAQSNNNNTPTAQA